MMRVLFVSFIFLFVFQVSSFDKLSQDVSYSHRQNNIQKRLKIVYQRLKKIKQQNALQEKKKKSFKETVLKELQNRVRDMSSD